MSTQTKPQTYWDFSLYFREQFGHDGYCEHCNTLARVGVLVAHPEWQTMTPGEIAESFDKVVEYCFGGKKIQAIKEFRMITGWSLYDSKDAVEAINAAKVGYVENGTDDWGYPKWIKKSFIPDVDCLF